MSDFDDEKNMSFEKAEEDLISFFEKKVKKCDMSDIFGNKYIVKYENEFTALNLKSEKSSKKTAKNKAEKKKKNKNKNKKELILKNALKLFARKGFENTKIEEIAKSSGISKGAVYLYFKSKREILKTLLEKHAEFLYESVFEFHAKSKNMREILRDLIYFISDFYKKNPDIYIVFRKNLLSYENDDLKSVYLKMLEKFDDITDYYRKSNKIRSEKNFNISFFIDSVFVNFIFFNSILNKNFSHEDIDEIIDMMLYGIIKEEI
jgi:AcrR family transcriptional regulator